MASEQEKRWREEFEAFYFDEYFFTRDLSAYPVTESDRLDEHYRIRWDFYLLACQSMQAEVDEAREQLEASQTWYECAFLESKNKIDQLEEKLKRASDVIGFYADEKSYETIETKYDHYPTILGDVDVVNGVYCGGKRARQWQKENK